ncbi:MAG: hypothetical protein WKG07_36370 [Hymenobacter sp.]
MTFRCASGSSPTSWPQLGITAADIQAALAEQNAQIAAGSVGAPPAQKGPVVRVHCDGAGPPGHGGAVRTTSS